ncbi:MAG: hypothetical protein MPL62_14855 [Alphaproteobacteria bacterium]|nr:hypothetical protein [Alphaproteobacteria bacterium]
MNTSTDLVVTGEQITEIARAQPQTPIIFQSEYCVAYIKDHTFYGSEMEHNSEVKNHPIGCFVRGNKVHFYYCTTLEVMSEKGRRQRYRAATFTDSDDRLIDLRDAGNVITRLAWCKHCLTILARNGSVGHLGAVKNSRMAEYGGARGMTQCVQMLHNSNNSVSAKRQTQTFFANTLRRR